MNEPKPVKLFSYIWLYLGVWIVAAIGASLLLNALDDLLHLGSAGGTGVAVAVLMLAGNIMTHQFYKRHHRAFTAPELKYMGRRIALISLIIGILFVGLMLIAQDPMPWWAALIALVIGGLINWGLVVLSLNYGNKTILKRISKTKSVFID